MNQDVRIPLSQARCDVEAGTALLACAGDDPAKRADMHDEALPPTGLEKRLGELPPDREILFICA